MTSRTITALYDSYDEATRAVTKLEAAGIPHGDISLVGNDGRSSTTAGHGETAENAETGAGTGATLGTVLGGGAGLLAGLGLMAIPGVGPVVAAGWLVATLTGAGIGAAAGGLAGSLTGAGLSETDAHAYAEGVRRGGTLLTVRSEEAQQARVMDILEEHGAVDLDERQSNWNSEGWTAPATTSGTVGRDEAIPVVEEQLHGGKREVEPGRVRVRSYAVETPVNEEARLNDESVHADRRPVDRAVNTGDRALSTDRTIGGANRGADRTEVEVEDQRGNPGRTGTTDPLPKR